ncbi:diacylglycerol kinase family protein [Chloroflexus sp.]|uniref:diacylglycerol kinase family protein n=1 Tax=Chloroflexus sp. TaxID=1904827 RepID=UPI0026310EA1|nr:diacylglycerol kinase family protein [uncultured Chloroflexus sp.]
MAEPIDRSTRRFFVAFRYAFAGIGHLVRSQRNFQIHLLIGAIAIALGVALQITRWEWIALSLTITLVLAAEGVNTAIEATVDLVTREYQPLARVAKDVAAGTVLLCALGAIVVGVLIFGPRLWLLWQMLT